VVAVEVEPLLLELAPDDLELFGEDVVARADLVEREAVGAVFEVVPAGAEAEFDPAARDGRR